MVRHILKRFHFAQIALATGQFALPAHAGIAECNDLRLEDVSQCELQGDLNCSASCNELGVYKKACATKLTTVCQQQCTLEANPTCTDSCTEQCSSQCDLGVNVICSHNCFGECTKNCDFDCELSDNVEQCHASCEANCDNECDIKCKPLVEGSCYQHCIECCGGSCKAQANMDCQTTCQEQQFESCEYQFQADCQASCTGEGALFCDGEYVLSGSQIPSCAGALVARGVQGLHLETTGQLDVHGSQATAQGKARASCNFAATQAPQPLSVGVLSFAVMAALGLYRRSQRMGC